MRFARLALLFLAHAVGTSSITLVVAMGPALQHSLRLDHADFGLMVAAYYGALLLWALPAGWVVDRLGIGRALALAHGFLGLGMLTLAGAQGFLAAAAGLFVSGIGYALVNPATARGVLLWFPPRGRATAMGVKQTGVPAGSVAAALMVAAVGGEAWRDVALAAAVLTFVAGCGFMILGARRPSADLAIRVADVRHLLGRPRLAYFNTGACLYATGQGAFFAYLVLFAHEALGADPGRASLCLALAHGASAAGRVAWGLAGDILRGNGRKKGLIACGLVGAAGVGLLAATPGLGGTGLLLPVALVLGLTIGGYAALTQTAAVEMVEPRLAGASIGYNMLTTSTGTMLGPALFGVGLNLAGYVPAWAAVAAALALGAWLFHRGLVPGIDASARAEGSGR